MGRRFGARVVVAAFTAFGGVLVACGAGGGAGKIEAPVEPKSEAESAPVPPPTGPPVRVDCGDFTTCAVTNDGAVRCWGRDKSGETGDGNGPDRSRNVPVPGLGKATSVALASNFACALLEDKKVKCWGSGQLANDGKARQHARATDVAGLDGVLDLSASGAIACARMPGSVACWGADRGTIGSPPAGTFKQVATAVAHACALDAAGAVTCWGTGDWAGTGAFAKPAVKGATAIAIGDRHGCIVGKDKKVFCWGQNDAGQLGIKADSDAHKKLVEVRGVTGVVKLVAGEASTCALLGDGSARCWGSNSEGELGLGKRSGDERPTKLSSLTDIADLCLATTHGCALTKSKQIHCWGGNRYGQLGDGTKESKLSPTPVAW